VVLHFAKRENEKKNERVGDRILLYYFSFCSGLLGFLQTSLPVNRHLKWENPVSSCSHAKLLPGKLITELFCRKVQERGRCDFEPFHL
jgi:hypothetical protein